MSLDLHGIPALAEDHDLCFNAEYGVAWQADMAVTAQYDAAYYRKCASYDGHEIGDVLNRGRIEFVARHYSGRMLDVGIGSGEFVRRRPFTWGFDINPEACRWLAEHGKLATDLDCFAALSFWDVLEHLPDMRVYLRHVHLQGFLFASVPIFEDLARVRESRHYRPGEHLTYWTQAGFERWMTQQGFLLLERSDFETRAGRDSIGSFAFRRIAWPGRQSP